MKYAIARVFRSILPLPCASWLQCTSSVGKLLRSDSGQMHLAAAMHKMQVVFFGDIDQKLWRPRSGESQIKQTSSGDCSMPVLMRSGRNRNELIPKRKILLTYGLQIVAHQPLSIDNWWILPDISHHLRQ